MNTVLAFDPGFGNTKLYGQNGQLVMQSAVSSAGSSHTYRVEGLRATRSPLRIETAAGPFYVGERAHDWGRPVENLDLERLTGSPEMLALLYAALTKYGVPSEQISLVVGLPIGALSSGDAPDTKRAVRTNLSGEHRWSADGVERRAFVDQVRIASQPVGAMFDYLLDDEGHLLAAHQVALTAELGVLGIGMNTVDLLVVREGAAVSRYTVGDTLGVRRLLQLCGGSTYSLAELDLQLRAGVLNVEGAVKVWESEVVGFVEKSWGSNCSRFETIVGVGGGIALLKQALLRRFRDRLFIPDDPIIATARGLYKYSLMQVGKGRG